MIEENDFSLIENFKDWDRGIDNGTLTLRLSGNIEELKRIRNEILESLKIKERVEKWINQIKNNPERDELLKTNSKVHGIWLSDKLQQLLKDDKK